jgi:hypothetical protein
MARFDPAPVIAEPGYAYCAMWELIGLARLELGWLR